MPVSGVGVSGGTLYSRYPWATEMTHPDWEQHDPNLVMPNPHSTIPTVVYLCLLEVSCSMVVDRILFELTGIDEPILDTELRAAIYAEGPTLGSPAGGELLVESESIVITEEWLEMGGDIIIPDTSLGSGPHYLAFQGNSDEIKTSWHSYRNSLLRGWWYTQDYGYFSNPCPDVLEVGGGILLGVRVKES